MYGCVSLAVGPPSLPLTDSCPSSGRYNLGSEDLRLLEREMQRLFQLGYRWSHTYTQCVLQTLLRSIRRK